MTMCLHMFIEDTLHIPLIISNYYCN